MGRKSARRKSSPVKSDEGYPLDTQDQNLELVATSLDRLMTALVAVGKIGRGRNFDG